jgi:hypothetical protein
VRIGVKNIIAVDPSKAGITKPKLGARRKAISQSTITLNAINAIVKEAEVLFLEFVNIGSFIFFLIPFLM